MNDLPPVGHQGLHRRAIGPGSHPRIAVFKMIRPPGTGAPHSRTRKRLRWLTVRRKINDSRYTPGDARGTFLMSKDPVDVPGACHATTRGLDANPRPQRGRKIHGTLLGTTGSHGFAFSAAAAIVAAQRCPSCTPMPYMPPWVSPVECGLSAISRSAFSSVSTRASAVSCAFSAFSIRLLPAPMHEH